MPYIQDTGPHTGMPYIQDTGPHTGMPYDSYKVLL